MKLYRYTDKLLILLAIANILILLPQIWVLWFPLQIVFWPHTGDATQYVLNILIHGLGIGFIISTVTAYAFFKRWRWLLFLYIPYCFWMLSFILPALKMYDDPRTDSSFYLPDKVYNWSLLALIALTLLTTLIFLIETFLAKRKGYGNSVIFKK